MVGAAGSIVAAGCMVAAAVSLVVRLRRAGGEQRQQIKWLAYGGALVVCGVCAGSLTIPRSVPVSILIMSVSLLGLPVLTGIAIVRHRLYDIDLLINRTLVYASLTAMLALVYVAGVIGLQAALRALTGQESTLAIVASTLAIAPCSTRCAEGCKASWTGASTDASTMPQRLWPPSTPACETRRT
jgi:hypothetical protein